MIRLLRRLQGPHVLLVAGLLCTAVPAAAQGRIGVRAGASVDPDQFFFGGHYETRPIADHIYFRPNVEVGFGNDVTLAAFNFELVYKFPSRRPWTVYAGGGPALNLIRSDGEGDAEGGFNLLLGAEHRKGLFGEVKVGAIDSPDFKITIGYTFRP